MVLRSEGKGLTSELWRVLLPRVTTVRSHERADERRHGRINTIVFHVIYEIQLFMILSFDTIQPLETGLGQI